MSQYVCWYSASSSKQVAWRDYNLKGGSNTQLNEWLCRLSSSHSRNHLNEAGSQTAGPLGPLNGNPTGTSRGFWYWGSGQEPRATFFLGWWRAPRKKNVKMPWRSNKLIVSVQQLLDNWTCKYAWYQRSGSTRSDLNWASQSASYLHYRPRVHYVPEESYDESCTIIQFPGGLRWLIMWRRRILSHFDVEEILPSVVCKWECRRQTGARAYHSCTRAKAGYPTPLGIPPTHTPTPEWVA